MGRVKNCILVISLEGAIVLGGCGYSPEQKAEMLKLARTNGLMAYYNGFGSGAAGDSSKEIAGEFGMVHIHGDDSFLDELLKASEESDYGAHLTLHSMGSVSADRLLGSLEKKGLGFRCVYPLDAFTAEEFPKSAGIINNGFSEAPYVFGKQSCYGGLGIRHFSVPNSDHFNLPYRAQPNIREGIRNSRRSFVHRKIPMETGK